MSKKLPTPQELEALDASILQKLTDAAEPLTKMKLIGRKNDLKESRLTNLRANSQVMRVPMKKNSEAFILTSDYSGRFSPSQMCKNAILQRVGESLTALSCSKRALKGKNIPLYAQHQEEEAITQLATEGLLIRITGKNFLIGTAGVIKHLTEKNQLPLFKPTQETTHDVAPKAAGVTEEMVHKAYAEIRQPGRSLLEIGAIQRYLNCSLIDLHSTIIKMVEARLIFITTGESSLLSEEDVKAGLSYRNKKYYFIETN